MDFLPEPPVIELRKRKVSYSNDNFPEVLKRSVLSETVEKGPKRIPGGDAGENDPTECTTINDLTMARGRETPRNHPIMKLKVFSTVSADIEASLIS